VLKWDTLIRPARLPSGGPVDALLKTPIHFSLCYVKPAPGACRVLVVALVGSAIGIVAGLVSMVRAIAGTEGAPRR
jgi:hypothetical protein